MKKLSSYPKTGTSDNFSGIDTYIPLPRIRMSINPEVISGFWMAIGTLLYALFVLKAIVSAQWWRLKNQSDLNVLLFAILGVFFIWIMKAEFAGSQSSFALNLHLLGATLLTMMFGWAFAILAISIVLLAFSLFATPSVDTFYSLPWNALLSGILPVVVSYSLFRLIDRRLPNNFFIYIFICTFFGAALAMASVILATTVMHILTSSFSIEYLSYNYIPYGLLLMFPEAFITGMLMSIFVAYRPQWVSTFDDRRYLQKH
jgi:uncharacterized membrane protein